jgi:hypothetical protein
MRRPARGRAPHAAVRLRPGRDALLRRCARHVVPRCGGGVRSARGGSAFGGAPPQVVVIQAEFLTRCPADGSHMPGYPSFSFQAATTRAKMQPKREMVLLCMKHEVRLSNFRGIVIGTKVARVDQRVRDGWSHARRKQGSGASHSLSGRLWRCLKERGSRCRSF